MNKDTALMRGVRTAIQAGIGFVTGLVLAVWHVPGVQQVVTDYVTHNGLQILVTIGIPASIASGVAAFVWNWARTDVKNF